MISFLTGTIVRNDIGDGVVTILTSSGVGYEVRYSTNAETGAKVDLHIYTRYSDSAISLWGFNASSELEIFKKLLTVSGVGPASAYSLIMTLGADRLVNSIVNGDSDALKVPGVGKKISQRIVLELHEKMSEHLNPLPGGIEAEDTDEVRDATLALISLGSSKEDVKRYFASLDTGELTAAELIKSYLTRQNG